MQMQGVFINYKVTGSAKNKTVIKHRHWPECGDKKKSGVTKIGILKSIRTSKHERAYKR